MKQWYLVFCKPRQEDKAQINLERQGYPTYLPKLQQTRRRAGKRIQVVEPLFPRYLFIHLDDSTDNWSPIRSTLGVTSLVRFGHQAAIVPPQIIAVLQEREDEHGLQRPGRPDLEPGARVRLLQGPLQHYDAIFLAKSGKDRVTILLDILGKQTRVQVDIDHIEASGWR
jgi:transcriptional antiterminator RfaH